MTSIKDGRREARQARGILPGTPIEPAPLEPGILPGTLSEKRADERKRKEE